MNDRDVLEIEEYQEESRKSLRLLFPKEEERTIVLTVVSTAVRGKPELQAALHVYLKERGGALTNITGKVAAAMGLDYTYEPEFGEGGALLYETPVTVFPNFSIHLERALWGEETYQIHPVLIK